MKDNRFIELVNLYIDRQISGEEMAALEAEMQANPRRRAVYRQYCQMHRATTLVYESFRTDPTGQASENSAASTAVARFEPQHRHRTPWAYYAAGLAAACVALVFAKLSFNKTTGQAPVVAALATKPSSAVAVVESPTVVTALVAKAPQVSVPVENPIVEQDYAAMLLAMRREEQRAFANGQIQPSRPRSLFEDGVFDAEPASSMRVFPKKSTSTQPSEFAAFQFQR